MRVHTRQDKTENEMRSSDKYVCIPSNDNDSDNSVQRKRENTGADARINYRRARKGETEKEA